MSAFLESQPSPSLTRVLSHRACFFGIIGLVASGSPFRETLAAQSIDWLRAAPSEIPTGSATAVLATTQVGVDPTLLPQSVTLLRYDSNGRLVATLGRMYDDATHGDVLPGDGIFSAQASFNEARPGAIILKASVGYRGLLKRIISDPAVVMVQSTVTAEHTIHALASALLTGDKIAALTYFDGSEVDRNTLMGMDSTRMTTLATAFSNAQLMSATDVMRVYTSHWVNQGQSVDIEFTMIRDSEGKWIIASW